MKNPDSFMLLLQTAMPLMALLACDASSSAEEVDASSDSAEEAATPDASFDANMDANTDARQDAMTDASLQRYCAGPDQPEALRVMTFNIQRARDYSLEQIADVIQAVQPDVVGLQEVDMGTNRSSGVLQLNVLKSLTGMEGVFGRAIDYDGGEYGIGILSRTPLAGVEVHALPGAGEKRALLVADIETKGRSWTFAVTHLGLSDEARLQQVAEVKSLLTGRSNRIVVGDMNFVPDSEPHKAMSSVLTDAWNGPASESFTSPAALPVKRIDYIFADDELLPALCSEVWPTVVSDHRAVVAAFRPQ